MDENIITPMDIPDLGLAVSGISGRFASADSVEELKHKLTNNCDMQDDPDCKRWPYRLWGVPPRAGRIKDIRKFDAEFFGYTRETAQVCDHQLRILYEVIYESILDSGVNPASLRGTNTGLFMGIHTNEFDYAMRNEPNFQPNGYMLQCAVKAAQYFDFRGQVTTYDIACASSFGAFHEATTNLRLGMMDQVVVCSAVMSIHPSWTVGFAELQMISPTGYLRFGDASANGYVKSEACVSIFVQKKDVANRLYCSILATKTNVDGYTEEGITYPSIRAQETLIRETKQMVKGLHSDHVEIIECHGTGTPAGDPVECNALANVYCPRDDTNERTIGPLLLGSIKTNIGHSEGASGLCSLAKVILMLENDIIYKSLHFDKPNLNIDPLIDGRAKIVTENRKLIKKIIPMSCYGFGGANVHAIFRGNHKNIVESVTKESMEFNEHFRLILMFGRNRQSLEEFFNKIMFDDEIKQKALTRDFFALIDLLCSGPIDRLMYYRGFTIVDIASGQEIIRSIEECRLKPKSDEKTNNDFQTIDIGRPYCHYQDSNPRDCCFVFPGFGCHWNGMALGLKECKNFWSTIERLDEILKPFKFNLIETLESKRSKQFTLLEASTCITAIQIALTNFLKSDLSIKVTGSIVGHSIGEVACTYAAGILDERQAIIVTHHLINTCEENHHIIKGMMVALDLDYASAQNIIDTYKKKLPIQEQLASTIYIACDNGPQSVTISGSQKHIEEFLEYIKISFGNRVNWINLDIGYALHNPFIMSDEIKRKLISKVSEIILPNIGDNNNSQVENCLTSSVENHHIGYYDTNMNYAEYFANNICSRVNFNEATKSIELAKDPGVIEIGPHGLYESIFRTTIKSTNENTRPYIKLMKKNDSNQLLTLFTSVGKIFQSGIPINISKGGLYPSVQYPVNRQVPSISSLMNWDHTDSHYVPKYPEKFSNSSRILKVQVDILRDIYKHLSDHMIDGRVLFPATGYLTYVWMMFSCIKRNIRDLSYVDFVDQFEPIEFHNVRLLRAVILSESTVSTLSIVVDDISGKFEIKEGGQLVADGLVRTPPVEFNNNSIYKDIGLGIKNEHSDSQAINHDDIYKQFRLNGYEYGKLFRCLQSSSLDGRHVKIEFNGHMIALTDNILQSLFLSITSNLPHGSMFLPTGFDYIRFQPDKLLAKIKLSRVKIESISKSFKENFRNSSKELIAENILAANDESTTTIESNSIASTCHQEPKKSCIFDAFCDSITGMIITDGIVIKGMNVVPVQRREPPEPLLELYKFLPDFEEPVNDVELSGNSFREHYDRVCSSSVFMLMDLYHIDYRFFNLNQEHNDFVMSKSLVNNESLRLNKNEIDEYIQQHLICRYNKVKKMESTQQVKRINNHNQTEDAARQKQISKISELVKNKSFSLLSLYDSLLNGIHLNPMMPSDDISTTCNSIDKIRKIKSALTISMNDHGEKIFNSDTMLSSLSSERFLRPLIESIIDNSCQMKNKLHIIEINNGGNILFDYIGKIISDTATNVEFNYTVAHPHPDILNLQSNSIIRLHNLKNIDHEEQCSLLTLTGQKDHIDVVCLYDNSCYSLTMDDGMETLSYGPVFTNLTKVIRKDGFLLIMVRHQLSFAERFIMALKQIDLSNYRDSSDDNGFDSNQIVADDLFNRMGKIQAGRKASIEQLEQKARLSSFELISKKMDTTGCTLYLYKNKSLSSECLDTDNNLSNGINDCTIIHIKHDNYASWLGQLKARFKNQNEINNKLDDKQIIDNEKKQADDGTKTIWVCAVATKDKPNNGIVGMVQCLRRELSSMESCGLRCFFDLFTFKNRPEEELTLNDIESCKNFQLALKRDLFWNCINANNQWGCFRHMTLNNYFNINNISNLENGETHSISTDRAYVNVSKLGDLSSFRWYEAPLLFSSEDETRVQVKVNYSALNFKDIMLATGKLPLNCLPLELATTDCLLGLEFSGFDIKRNRRVCGMTLNRSVGTEIISDKNTTITIDVPDSMSLKDAATIPVVYLTALAALVCRGKIQKGETILIHAGSGGVGQAALRLAIHYGLEVFTTVGSEEKRRFLLEEFSGKLKPENIYNSRNCSFETLIMRATLGKGVDLVLNSLADDKLQASLRCLKNNGRFLEIGKYDQAINTEIQLTELDTNKTFHSVHLDKLFDSDTITPGFMKVIKLSLKLLNEGIKSGYIKPIRHTCFSRESIEEAFRYMATGKHIGKVLIEIEPETIISQCSNDRPSITRSLIRAIPRFELDPSLSYIVTGALGGFGLELTKWLASVGARHFVLTSRTGVRTGYQKLVFTRIKENQNCKVLVVDSKTADGTTQEGIEKLFQMAKDLSPIGKIGGVFHLAVVLKDSLLENMTSEKFDLVCKPKADACILMDEISRKVAPNMPYFVAFSSVTSGRGNAGQINYGYANSVMERVCERRRHDNLHGLAIQWGAIGDVGLAYETFGGNDVVIGGTRPQRMSSCFSTLSNLLRSPFAVCSSIVLVDRHSNDSSKKGDLVGALLHILGIKDLDQVNEQTTLREFGLDSLMAVEIRQYLEREYELTLAVAEIGLLTIAKIREMQEALVTSDGTSISKRALDSERIRADKEIVEKVDLLKRSNFTGYAKVDKEFKPSLELPKVDCIYLNDPQEHLLKPPVFMLSPVHGGFEGLELISKKIARPCVGLNYTSKLNKFQNSKEMAQFFLRLLEDLDWSTLENREKRNAQDRDHERIVDIVGYSFGSIVAYELMVLIQQQTREGKTNLRSGQYILLDFSPKGAEIFGKIMSSIFNAKTDEFLVDFIRQQQVDSNKILLTHEQIMDRFAAASVQTDLRSKYALTCEILSEMLNITDKSKQNDLLDAIESYHKRFLIMFSYKAHKSYVGNPILIRAEDDVITDVDGSKMADDLLLSEVIIGQAIVYKFPGNHSSFVSNNTDQICDIINGAID